MPAQTPAIRPSEGTLVSRRAGRFAPFAAATAAPQKRQNVESLSIAYEHCPQVMIPSVTCPIGRYDKALAFVGPVRPITKKMPELPDILLYLHALRPRIGGRHVRGVRLASPFLLRSIEPPLSAIN